MRMSHPIGGFMSLEKTGPATTRHVLGLWQVSPRNSWFFSNARSALFHFLQANSIKRLWLPAYICPEFTALSDAGIPTSYYPLTATLSPDVPLIENALRPGDCVLVVDYFGRPPDRQFLDFAATRPDIRWVEDAAQALMPVSDSWGQWVLYSPRKLFGLPDGGILVHTGGDMPDAAYDGADVVASVAPRISGDPYSRLAEYQRAEANIRLSRQRMSRLSRDILLSIDPQPVMERRRENFAFLAERLDPWLLDGFGTPTFTPLGVPVKVPKRDRVWRRICDEGVYPALHWPNLPSSAAEFEREHALSQSIMTLPCDQRYDHDDMERVAAVFEGALQ